MPDFAPTAANHERLLSSAFPKELPVIVRRMTGAIRQTAQLRSLLSPLGRLSVDSDALVADTADSSTDRAALGNEQLAGRSTSSRVYNLELCSRRVDIAWT